MKIKINQASFTIDTIEHQEYWKYINSGAWEPETFKTIDLFLNKGDVAIDIGAWAGPVSLYLAQKAKTVYAIEPDPFIYADLAKNCDLNSTLNVHPFQLAISNKSEKLKLFARKKYGQSSSSLLHRSYDQLSSEHIQAISLSDFILQQKIKKIDFIKIDTEGGEFIFLKEWKSILDKLNRPTLLISFHIKQLEENLLYKYVQSKLFAKILLKISRAFSFSIPKKHIQKELQEINSALNEYPFVYSLDGKEVSFKDLVKNTNQIGNNSFIFSKNAWSKND